MVVYSEQILIHVHMRVQATNCSFFEMDTPAPLNGVLTVLLRALGCDRDPFVESLRPLLPLYCRLGDTYLRHSHTKEGVAGFALVKINETLSNMSESLHTCAYFCTFVRFLRKYIAWYDFRIRYF